MMLMRAGDDGISNRGLVNAADLLTMYNQLQYLQGRMEAVAAAV